MTVKKEKVFKISCEKFKFQYVNKLFVETESNDIEDKVRRNTIVDFLKWLLLSLCHFLKNL